jgi:transmembrane sensor
MSADHKRIDLDDINAQAAQWIERRDFGTWNSGEQARLDRWLAESAAHRVAFLRLNSSWKRTERLIALRAPSKPAAIEPKPKRNIVGIAVLAFAFVAVVAGGVALRLSVPQYKTYATVLGGHRIIALNDGSRIELNTDTRIRVSDGQQRQVWLDQGEAYFQIKHNAAHPFTVLASGNRIVDLGTSFLIRKEPSRLEVALIEGRARFEPSNSVSQHPTVLASGDVVVATADSVSLTRKSQRNLAGDLGWRRGVLVFDYTTLADAAAEFNRYNHQKIIVADADVARHTVVGTFPATNVELFGHVVQVILGLRVEQHKDEIIISR